MNERYKEYAPTIARYGVGIVFFIFGIWQLFQPEAWFAWIPSFVTNMIDDYVKTGKVKFVAKYMQGHSGGHPAQLVALCLNEQDLYWDFYPQAFANQADVEDLTKMKALAQTVGADMTELQTCLDSNKYESRFDSEQNEGISAGAQGTPAFFVNGLLVSGAVPYSQVKSVIEAELAA